MKKEAAKALLAAGIPRLADAPGEALRAGPMGHPPRVPGDGRRRQGRRHQARHVGRQPAGLPGLLVQGAVGRGARSRLPLAHVEVAARARADRHLQPLLLRGGARRPRAPGVPGQAEAAAASSSTKHIWKERYEDINAFERYLSRNGYVIRKFFLNVSKEEQKPRFLERLDEPEKNWKFSVGDVKEREHWDDYMAAYEDTIRAHRHRARAVGRRARRQQVVRPSSSARRSSRLWSPSGWRFRRWTRPRRANSMARGSCSRMRRAQTRTNATKPSTRNRHRRGEERANERHGWSQAPERHSTIGQRLLSPIAEVQARRGRRACC